MILWSLLNVASAGIRCPILKKSVFDNVPTELVRHTRQSSALLAIASAPGAHGKTGGGPGSSNRLGNLIVPGSCVWQAGDARGVGGNVLAG